MKKKKIFAKTEDCTESSPESTPNLDSIGVDVASGNDVTAINIIDKKRKEPDINVVSEKVYKDGYVVQEVEIDNLGDKPFIMKQVYNPNMEYIGNVKDARYLIIKRGIKPQLAKPSHNVCSIGFSNKDGKWYGWSHRAIFGFKTGSKCKKGDCHYIPKEEGGKGEWTAKNIVDAKQMAIDFANGVS